MYPDHPPKMGMMITRGEKKMSTSSTSSSINDEKSTPMEEAKHRPTEVKQIKKFLLLSKIHPQ